MAVELNFKLFPQLDNCKWDDIEIDPIKKVGEIEESCEENECDFWSVFLHQLDGGRICVANVPTRTLAEGMAELLYNAVNQAETRLAEPT